MGIVAWGSYMGIYFVLPVNAAALAVSILLAGIVYFVALMALGGVEEEDLRRLPKGYLLVSFGKKCYLLRDPDYVKCIKEEKETKKKTKNRNCNGSAEEIRFEKQNRNPRERACKDKGGSAGKNDNENKDRDAGKNPGEDQNRNPGNIHNENPNRGPGKAPGENKDGNRAEKSQNGSFDREKENRKRNGF